MTTNYKFQSENEYQLWCQSKINGIYYSNIAMNGDKIAEHVQDIARALHCSEGEQLVKPEPQVYVIEYNVGVYDDYRDYTIAFRYDGTLDQLVNEIKEKSELYAKRYDAICSSYKDYDQRMAQLMELDNETTVYGVGCEFNAGDLYDVYTDNKLGNFTVVRINEWIDRQHNV